MKWSKHLHCSFQAWSSSEFPLRSYLSYKWSLHRFRFPGSQNHRTLSNRRKHSFSGLYVLIHRRIRYRKATAYSFSEQSWRFHPYLHSEELPTIHSCRSLTVTQSLLFPRWDKACSCRSRQLLSSQQDLQRLFWASSCRPYRFSCLTYLPYPRKNYRLLLSALSVKFPRLLQAVRQTMLLQSSLIRALRLWAELRVSFFWFLPFSVAPPLTN